ncbi:hypothetical protein LOD99_8606 [Oopsacas minuta]|uniref:Uncharacterized protein n=1 Tax=Oopsacas minuta TaxID=111878 RepID=A0AAV7JH71_9METZ|nr:hypothetical protein LOD99_8606 [Oopsacas minuta]
METSIETAVDERRHDAVDNGEVVTHLARTLSVGDMFDQVCKRRPEGTPLPSIQWFRRIQRFNETGETSDRSRLRRPRFIRTPLLKKSIREKIMYNTKRSVQKIANKCN